MGQTRKEYYRTSMNPFRNKMGDLRPLYLVLVFEGEEAEEEIGFCE
jgi:hypothetical protein